MLCYTCVALDKKLVQVEQALKDRKVILRLQVFQIFKNLDFGFTVANVARVDDMCQVLDGCL